MRNEKCEVWGELSLDNSSKNYLKSHFPRPTSHFSLRTKYLFTIEKKLLTVYNRTVNKKAGTEAGATFVKYIKFIIIN